MRQTFSVRSGSFKPYMPVKNACEIDRLTRVASHEEAITSHIPGSAPADPYVNDVH